MLTIEKRSDGMLQIFADGQLTTGDCAAFVTCFEQLARQGPAPLRIELGPDFSGWSLAVLWRNMKLDQTNGEHFGRIAVIGDSRWEQWGTELTDAASSGQMRFFERGEEAGAEEWLLCQSRS